MSAVASTPDALSCALRGVLAVKGALVTCRDAAAVEMLLRMNKSYTPSFVAAVLHSEEGASPSAGVAGEADAGLFFVRHAEHVEALVRAWLNPFDSAERTSAVAARKRQRALARNEHADDDDDDDDDEEEGSETEA